MVTDINQGIVPAFLPFMMGMPVLGFLFCLLLSTAAFLQSKESVVYSLSMRSKILRTLVPFDCVTF